MNNRTRLLVFVALVLAGAYGAFFIDWHKRTKIQIFMEKSRASLMGHSETPGLIFRFPKPCALTSIEVVAAEDARTNKYPHPLWHLVAADKPVPTTSFGYGATIPGMKPEISTATPEALEVDTDYLLLVEDDKKLKGQMAFQLPY
jgi:hypothetical protein